MLELDIIEEMRVKLKRSIEVDKEKVKIKNLKIDKINLFLLYTDSFKIKLFLLRKVIFLEIFYDNISNISFTFPKKNYLIKKKRKNEKLALKISNKIASKDSFNDIYNYPKCDKFFCKFKKKLKKCSTCKKGNYKGFKLKKCSRCQEKYYCNKFCQKKDWLEHRKYCK